MSNPLDISLPLSDAEDQLSELSFLSSLSSADAASAGHEAEGQLAVDVAQTKEEVVIVATMAGADPGQIELHLHNDVLTIRGRRRSPLSADVVYFFEECYWGVFSRTIVLPVEVKPEMARAEYKSGVLTVHLQKIKIDRDIPIYVVEE